MFGTATQPNTGGGMFGQQQAQSKPLFGTNPPAQGQGIFGAAQPNQTSAFGGSNQQSSE